MIARREHPFLEASDEREAKRNRAHRAERGDHHARRERLAAVRSRGVELADRVLARFAEAERASVEIEVREAREHRAYALEITRGIRVARRQVGVDQAGE